MKYTSKTFTLPAAPSKITQAEWERIFGKPEPKKDKKRQEKSK